jgi:hypothetical protein
MLRNTSTSNGPDSFTIRPKSESYACTIQRLVLLNSKECDFRLAPASASCWSEAVFLMQRALIHICCRGFVPH